MKTITQLALGLLSLACAAATHGQTTSVATPMATSYSTPPSIRDYPGTLGQKYAAFNYTWQDVRGRGDAYDLGLAANVPLSPGLDMNIGYDYAWANDNHNPFTLQNYDVRYHTLSTGGTFYSPMTTRGPRPFLGGAVGYQWSRGDFSTLRTYDHTWVWGVVGGVEIPFGTLAITPHIAFVDTMERNSIGAWQMGGEVHTWFTETLGGFADATFHSPRTGGGRDSWGYTAGLRFRF